MHELISQEGREACLLLVTPQQELRKSLLTICSVMNDNSASVTSPVQQFELLVRTAHQLHPKELPATLFYRTSCHTVLWRKELARSVCPMQILSAEHTAKDTKGGQGCVIEKAKGRV